MTFSVDSDFWLFKPGSRQDATARTETSEGRGKEFASSLLGISQNSEGPRAIGTPSEGDVHLLASRNLAQGFAVPGSGAALEVPAPPTAVELAVPDTALTFAPDPAIPLEVDALKQSRPGETYPVGEQAADALLVPTLAHTAMVDQEVALVDDATQEGGPQPEVSVTEVSDLSLLPTGPLPNTAAIASEPEPGIAAIPPANSPEIKPAAPELSPPRAATDKNLFGVSGVAAAAPSEPEPGIVAIPQANSPEIKPAAPELSPPREAADQNLFGVSGVAAAAPAPKNITSAGEITGNPRAAKPDGNPINTARNPAIASEPPSPEETGQAGAPITGLAAPGVITISSPAPLSSEPEGIFIAPQTVEPTADIGRNRQNSAETKMQAAFVSNALLDVTEPATPQASALNLAAPLEGNATVEAASVSSLTPQVTSSVFLQGQVSPQPASMQLTPTHAVLIATPAQLPDIVARATSDGRDDRITVQLDPPELGRIAIDFKFDAQGLQHVTITAESPEAMRQLRQMHFELVQALERNGLSGQNMSFQHQNPQQNESWGQQTKSSRASLDGLASTGSGLIIAADSTNNRQGAMSGRLDLRL